jgi:two-component system chemotaxis response regulator CheY
VLEHLGIGSLSSYRDGAEAWTDLQRQPRPVLVCCDIRMPTMSGLDLLERIRADDRLKDTPVILITGQRDQATIDAAMHRRASGFFVKPFEPEDAESNIRAVIDAHLKHIAEKPEAVMRRLGITKPKLIAFYESLRVNVLGKLSHELGNGTPVALVAEPLAVARKGCETLGIWHGERILHDLAERQPPPKEALAHIAAINGLLDHLSRTRTSSFFVG